MDVFEAIDKRESIRSFLDQQITEQELEAILHAAERGPRIGGLDIVVLQDADKIRLISDTAKREMIRGGGWNKSRASTPDYNPLYHAPTVIMIYGRKSNPFDQVTTGIAVGMMILAATSLGLGSVTVSSIRHAFDGPESQALKALIGLTRSEDVILSLAVGYTDDPKAHAMKGAARNNVRYVR